MPFKSDKQRKFMWMNKPKIARKWTNEGKGYVEKKNKPRKIGHGRKK